jgi:hypothetical protein
MNAALSRFRSAVREPIFAMRILSRVFRYGAIVFMLAWTGLCIRSCVASYDAADAIAGGMSVLFTLAFIGIGVVPFGIVALVFKPRG